MNKTYKALEVASILDISESTLYTWVDKALPETMKPQKAMDLKVGKKVYGWNDTDLDNLFIVKELRREGLTYKEVNERLSTDLLAKEYKKARIEEPQEVEEITVEDRPSGLEILTLSLLTANFIGNIVLFYKLTSLK